VRFWDSSALVPLCVAQPSTQRARALHRDDSEAAVWWGSVVECASAIARVHRDGHLSEKEATLAQTALFQLRATWFEVQPGDTIREHAMRLLRVHPLRAADALQLAAALEWAGSPPAGEFVTFDERLRLAAAREGLSTP
jgi:predicted nucleic acid-binding protein